MNNIYTLSEVRAAQILMESGYTRSSNIHEAANELILLAEKIKAERVVCLMNT